MLWTILAVVLILNGLARGDALEIASAVLFGAVGVRRAVMQWEKPQALMNVGLIVLAVGLAIWQMGRGEGNEAKGRDVERAPAVAEWQAPQSKPYHRPTRERQEAPAPVAPSNERQEYPPMREILVGQDSLMASETWQMVEGKEHDVDRQGKECALQVAWNGAPISDGAVRIEVQTFPNSWVGYRQSALTGNKEGSPWTVKKVRAKPLGDAKNIRYQLWCKVAEEPPRLASGVAWVHLEKNTKMAFSPKDNGTTSSAFIKPNDCMAQIVPFDGLMGTTFYFEYTNGHGGWDRYDWHAMQGDPKMIWGEQTLRVTTVEGKAEFQLHLYCLNGKATTEYAPVEFKSTDSEGVVSGDATSNILKFKDVGARCFVRLNYISYSAGDDIWTDWIAGSGKGLTAEYRGLFLPTSDLEALQIRAKSGSYKNMRYSLECIKE